MSLIKCPDCGYDVSDTAQSCPKCGNPLKIKKIKIYSAVSIIMILFFIAGIFSAIIGSLMIIASKTIFHEMEYLILFLISIICFSVAVLSALLTKSQEHLLKAFGVATLLIIFSWIICSIVFYNYLSLIYFYNELNNITNNILATTLIYLRYFFSCKYFFYLLLCLIIVSSTYLIYLYKTESKNKSLQKTLIKQIFLSLVSFLFFLLILSTSFQIFGTKLDPRIFRKTCHDLYFLEQKIGFSCSTTQKIRHNYLPLIKTSIEQTLVMNRLDTIIQVKETVVTYETMDLKPYSFETKTEMDASGNSYSSSVLSSNGYIEEGKLIIWTESSGQKSKKVLENIQDLIFPAAILQKYFEKKPIVGDNLSYTSLEPSSQQIFQATVNFLKYENIQDEHLKETVYSKDKPFLLAETEMNLLGSLKLKEWLDEDYTPIITISEETNIKMVLIDASKTDQNLQTQEKETEEIFSLDKLSIPKPTGKVPNDLQVSKAQSITLKLKCKKPEVCQKIPENDNQKILSQEEKELILKIKRSEQKLHLNSLEQIYALLNSDQKKQYLSATPYIQKDDSDLISIAKEITKNEKDLNKKAIALNQWVFNNINLKNYQQAMASAKETFLKRQGDCTEHAILLAALLRSVRIPSRISIGLVFLNGSFSYQMWTEAFLGEWVSFDASLGENQINPTHVKFLDCDGSFEQMAQTCSSLMIYFGQLEIEFLEIN